MVPWWTAGRCPLEYGVIGLISKCSASGSACAQTVLLWHNVPCKCDLVWFGALTGPHVTSMKRRRQHRLLLCICTMLVAWNMRSEHHSNWTHVLQNSDSMKKVQAFAIPNSMDRIGSKAFQGRSSLQSITIPNSVTSIQNSVAELQFIGELDDSKLCQENWEVGFSGMQFFEERDHSKLCDFDWGLGFWRLQFIGERDDSKLCQENWEVGFSGMQFFEERDHSKLCDFDGIRLLRVAAHWRAWRFQTLSRKLGSRLFWDAVLWRAWPFQTLWLRLRTGLLRVAVHWRAWRFQTLSRKLGSWLYWDAVLWSAWPFQTLWLRLGFGFWGLPLIGEPDDSKLCQENWGVGFSGMQFFEERDHSKLCDFDWELDF